MTTLNLAIGLLIGYGIGGWKETHRWRDAMDLPVCKQKAPAAATAEAQELNKIFNDYSLPRLERREQGAA